MTEPTTEFNAEFNAATHPLRDQLRDYLSRVAEAGEHPANWQPTGYTRGGYLRVLEKIVRFFRGQQDDAGGIIDPYFEREWHYSTPSYALGAALLVANGRADLLDSAERAMIRACEALADGQAPDRHPDFFTIFLVKADELLAPLAAPERRERWRAALRRIDPERIYVFQLGKFPEADIHNWNTINCVGEFLRHRAGFGGNASWWEKHLPLHVQRFDDFGLYRDGALNGASHPLPYDAVTRYTLSVMLANGYDGPHTEIIRKRLLQGSLTALFVQSPTGEWPGVGRSAHHAWNDAALAACYEFAAHQLATHDPILAGACKRGAHLALKAIEPWQRPTGDLFIVRNRFEPEVRHGFERYSIHTTYNLWTVAALAYAYLLAGPDDEQIPEQVLPSEIGAYVVRLSPAFHQIVAANRGFFLQIDTDGDPSTNPTGAVRINRAGCNPQIGPSEGAVAVPRYTAIGPRRALSFGPAWRDVLGEWHALAQYGHSVYPSPLAPPEVDLTMEECDGVLHVRTTWRGLPCLRVLHTDYEIHPDHVRVRYQAEGQITGLRAEIPIFSFDGQAHSEIAEQMTANGAELCVAFGGSEARYTLPDAQAQFAVTDDYAATRTGILRYAYAETTASILELTYALSTLDQP